MIAADTSAWIDLLGGTYSPASKLLEGSLHRGAVVLPYPVLFELLSGPGMTSAAAGSFLQLPRLEVLPGMWERAAEMRKSLLSRNRKARAMDCLIAQSCIDHLVPLITSDKDFQPFTSFGLRVG